MTTITDISELLLELGLSGTVTDEERAIVQQCQRSAEAAIRRHLRYDPIQATRTEYYPQLDLLHGSMARSIWEVSDNQAYLRHETSSQSDELQVRHVPIRSITSLYIDYDGRFGKSSGAFPDETLQTEGVDYWANYDRVDAAGNSVCMDGIIRSVGRWPVEPGSVKLTYVAGYTENEFRGIDHNVDASPIWDAAKSEAIRRVNQVYARMKRSNVGFVGGPFTHERLGDYSYSVDVMSIRKYIGDTGDLLRENMDRLQEFVRFDLGVF